MSAVIRVNGQEQALEVATVADLLARHGVAPDGRGVAVAVNGAVVPRRTWATAPVADGDTVEIVRPLNGG